MSKRLLNVFIEDRVSEINQHFYGFYTPTNEDISALEEFIASEQFQGATYKTRLPSNILEGAALSALNLMAVQEIKYVDGAKVLTVQPPNVQFSERAIVTIEIVDDQEYYTIDNTHLESLVAHARLVHN